MLKMMQNNYEPSSSLQKSIARSDFSKKPSPLSMIPTTKLVTTKSYHTNDYDRRGNLDHLKPPQSNRMSPPAYPNENRLANLTNRTIVNKPNLYNNNTQLANRPLNHQYNDNASAYSSSDTDSLRNKNKEVILHDKLSHGSYDDDRSHHDHHDHHDNHHHHHHHHQPQGTTKVNRNYLLKMKKKYKYKISANVSGTKFDIGKCIIWQNENSLRIYFYGAVI